MSIYSLRILMLFFSQRCITRFVLQLTCDGCGALYSGFAYPGICLPFSPYQVEDANGPLTPCDTRDVSCFACEQCLKRAIAPVAPMKRKGALFGLFVFVLALV